MRSLSRYIYILCLLLIVASCNRNDSATTTQSEWGEVTFECSILDVVDQTTRSSQIYTLPEDLVPSAEELTLEISGSYIDPENQLTTPYSYGPLLLSDYTASKPMMIASDTYNAKFHWGEEGVEGESSPYFSASVDFEVIARGSTTEQLTISLQNSIICMEFDDIFSNYYTDAAFTISTGSGNSFDFSAATIDKIVFVEASTSLTLSGSAVGIRDGMSVSFNAAYIGSTTKQTLSRINITADSIGGENLNITLDDAITIIEPIVIELNPQ